MILLRLSTEINDVMVEVEGEANDLDQIQEAWESFVLATYQVENGHKPGRMKDLVIHEMNLTNPPKRCDEIVEVL
jgi:hypothetical protein